MSWCVNPENVEVMDPNIFCFMTQFCNTCHMNTRQTNPFNPV
jgi:hypothetical protein